MDNDVELREARTLSAAAEILEARAARIREIYVNVSPLHPLVAERLACLETAASVARVEAAGRTRTKSIDVEHAAVSQDVPSLVRLVSREPDGMSLYVDGERVAESSGTETDVMVAKVCELTGLAFEYDYDTRDGYDEHDPKYFDAGDEQE